MTPEELIVGMRRGPWFYLVGVGLFVVGIVTGGYILMTWLLAVMVGATTMSFQDSLSHQGIWFLAALFWLPSVFIWGVLCYLHIAGILDRQGSVMDFASLALATWLLGVQSRFLLTVIIVNWRVPRR